MSNIFILNGAQPYGFAPGKLNAAFAERATGLLTEMGHTVRATATAGAYEVDAEVETHRWADTILMQFPVNWMGAPWSFKKYMDDIYTAGMDGRLCNGDGRTAEAPKRNYGTGGTLVDTTYMLSCTLNTPSEAFNDPAEPFFEGRSLDDLLLPVHLNAKFFAMTPLPTFAAHDVMKDPQMDRDFARFDAHLAAHF
ncbi:MAG: NAD(P)H-dependent oxidoreductase [Pseudomonadota bacterium]